MSKIEKAIDNLRLAITSGNDVPVRRATVSADDLGLLLEDNARMRELIERLCDPHEEVAMCDMCGIRPEDTIDWDGVPFCNQCWDEWTKEDSR